jgi:arylsulfatase A-like enzyme/Tfp pilus assembly protein PilF
VPGEPSSRGSRLRRLVTRCLAAGLALVSCSAPEGPGETHGSPAGPTSLLVVTLDTTRPDHLGPYGGSDRTTPSLSALARQGMVFERAYAVAPITLPAHTSILTGLYPPQHRVRNNGIDAVGDQIQTLAERARAAGFRTGAFVAAAVLDSRYGLDQGFETYDDGLDAERRRDRWGIQERPATQVADAALGWLGTLPADQRFFAWVHFFDAHAPWEPPSPFRERFASDLYSGELAYQDSQLGRLLASPRVGKSTVVAVIGDHGESLGEHGESTHGMLVYNSTLRIPWVLEGPGVPVGRRLETAVSQVDVVPTLLRLLHLPADPELPGRDLLASGGEPAALEPGLYAESRQPFAAYGWSPLQAIVKGRWKLIRGVESELYDLAADPAESLDLAQREPGVVRELAAELQPYAAQESAARPLEEDSLAQLRSLGYVATGRATPAAGAKLRDPKRSIALHEEILSLFGHGGSAPADVVPALRRILDRDPGNLTALQELPQALLEAGRWEELDRAAARAVQAGADPAPIWLLQARGLRRQGKPGAALALLDKAIEQDRQLYPLWVEKISIQLAQSDTAAARRTVEAARELYDGRPWLDLQIARLVELPDGKNQAAEQRLRRSLADDPDQVDAYGVLADILVADRRVEEAVAVLRQGVEHQPQAAQLHSRLGLLLSGSPDLEGAERHLARAIELSAESSRPELQAALDGVTERRRAALSAPSGGSPSATGDPMAARLEQAVAGLEARLRANPDDLDALFQRAALAVERGDAQGAETYLRRALAVEPRQADVWNDLGVMVEQQGRLDDARECYEKALEFEPHLLQAMINLGVVARQQGDWAAAARHFEDALAQPAAPIDVQLELGNLYSGPLRQSALARSHYEAFLLAAPADPRAPQVRERLRDLPGG